jgi:outer membrane lipoprotein-sorting protein
MRRTGHRIGVVSAGAVCVALVGSIGLAPPGEPKKPRLPPVTSRPAAERDAALNRIEQRAKDVKSIAADFVQHTFYPVFDDHDTRTGALMLLKPQYLRVDWKKPVPPESIVYDGTFFWEIKHGLKQIIRWDLTKRRGAGQGKPRLDVGPFRFLAGVKAEELKKDYLVALVDTPKEEKTYRFLLVPLKPEERREFVTLEVWIDHTSLLPTRIRFTIPPNKEVETWTLKALKVNRGVTKGDFRVRVPRDYELIKDPL